MSRNPAPAPSPESLLNKGAQELIGDKGARWFLSKDGSPSDTFRERGFTSKKYASLWIESLSREVDSRCGFLFWLRGHSDTYSIVDRHGNAAKH